MYNFKDKIWIKLIFSCAAYWSSINKNDQERVSELKGQFGNSVTCRKFNAPNLFKMRMVSEIFDFVAYVYFFPSLSGIAKAQGEEAEKEEIAEVYDGLALLEGALKKCSKGKALFGGNKIGYLDIALGSFLGWIRVTEAMKKIRILNEEKTPGLVNGLRFLWLMKLLRMLCLRRWSWSSSLRLSSLKWGPPLDCEIRVVSFLYYFTSCVRLNWIKIELQMSWDMFGVSCPAAYEMNLPNKL